MRKRQREAESDGKKRKDMSILRNTHTHTYTHTHAFANELPLVTREEHFVASHSPAAVLVYENICVCVYPSKKKWMSMCVRACVCVCAPLLARAHMHCSLSPCLPRATVNLCCVRQATITATITTPSHSPPRPYPRPPRAPWGGAAWWSGRTPP